MTTNLLLRLGNLHARFKAASQANGHTMSILIRKWIEAYCNEHERSTKKTNGRPA